LGHFSDIFLLPKSNPICKTQTPKKAAKMLQSSFSSILPSSLPRTPLSSHKLLIFPSLSLTHYRQRRRQQQLLVLRASSYEVGGGYSDMESSVQEENKSRRTQQEWDEKPDPFQHEVIIKGGEQVISVLQEMITLVSSSLPFLHFFLVHCKAR
jgi:hypothetical protein